MSGSTFYERMSSKEMRHAYQLSYSIQMISEIPSAYDVAVDDGQDLYARTMVDAFYVHIRLLADFLVKQTKTKDFGPADFEVSWEVPTTVAAQRLAEHWSIASKYVVHFGHPRVPDDLAELEPFSIGSVWFADMAGNALTVLGRFVTAVEAQAARDDAPALSVARLRASYLRGSFDRACYQLGIDPAASGGTADAATGAPEC